MFRGCSRGCCRNRKMETANNDCALVDKGRSNHREPHTPECGRAANIYIPRCARAIANIRCTWCVRVSAARQGADHFRPLDWDISSLCPSPKSKMLRNANHFVSMRVCVGSNLYYFCPYKLHDQNFETVNLQNSLKKWTAERDTHRVWKNPIKFNNYLYFLLNCDLYKY